MFYGQQVLGRKAPLGRCWLLGCGRSVGRRAILREDVRQACELILEPEVPMALRLSAVLMHGVVLIHRTQVELTLKDVDRASRDLRRVAAPAGTLRGRARRGGMRDKTVLADAGNIFQVTFVPPEEGSDPFALFGSDRDRADLGGAPPGLGDDGEDSGWFEMTRALGDSSAATPSRSFEGGAITAATLLVPRARGGAGLSLTLPRGGDPEVFDAAGGFPEDEMMQVPGLDGLAFEPPPPGAFDDDAGLAPPPPGGSLKDGGGLSSGDDSSGGAGGSGQPSSAASRKRKRRLRLDEDEDGEPASVLDNATIRTWLRSADHTLRADLAPSGGGAALWLASAPPAPRGLRTAGTFLRKHIEEALRNIPQISGIPVERVLRHGMPRGGLQGGASGGGGGCGNVNLARQMELFSRNFPKEVYLGGLSRKKQKLWASTAPEAGSGPTTGTPPEMLRGDDDEVAPPMMAADFDGALLPGDADRAPSATPSDVPSEVEKLRGLLAPDSEPSPGAAFRRPSVSPGGSGPGGRASRGSGRASLGDLLGGATPGGEGLGPSPTGLSQLGLSQFELLTQSLDPESESQLPESQRNLALALTPECLQTLQYLTAELRKLGEEGGAPGELELGALLRRARLNRTESARVFYRLLVLHSNRLLRVAQDAPYGEVRITLWHEAGEDGGAPSESPRTPPSSAPGTHSRSTGTPSDASRSESE